MLIFRAWATCGETNRTIRWLEIYPPDSSIHLLNNWGLDQKAAKSVWPVNDFVVRFAL